MLGAGKPRVSGCSISSGVAGSGFGGGVSGAGAVAAWGGEDGAGRAAISTISTDSPPRPTSDGAIAGGMVLLTEINNAR